MYATVPTSRLVARRMITRMSLIESARSGESPGASAPDIFGNRLLGALPAAEQARFATLVDVVALERQQHTNLYDAPMRTVDFPIDAIMSVVTTLSNGSTCEVATVGCEGFVEVDAALASRIAHRTSFCQIPGHVARMPIDGFQAEFGQDAEFRTLVCARSGRARS